MCSMELLKKLSEGAQGPLRADACLAWRQRLLHLPYPINFYLVYPDRCVLLRVDLSQGKAWCLGQCRG